MEPQKEQIMKQNKIILVGILILSVFLAACGTAVAQTPEAQERTVSVNGTAQVSLTPDIAYITIGVTTENADAALAVERNNTQALNVINTLTALGISEDDILTNNFNIYPTPVYTPEGQQRDTTFTVTNTVFVTLRDLDQVGEVLGSVVESGANQIAGIQFDVADKTAALSEARKMAVANSRILAEELAEAAGVELGPVKSISMLGSNYPVAVRFEREAADMAVGSVPISSGQLTLTVDVNVVYELR
jgi:uncharacterized protein